MRSVDGGAVRTDGMNSTSSRLRRNDQNGPGISNFDGSECQLDGMAGERVAESFPQVEGRHESWSLPARLAPPRKPSM